VLHTPWISINLFICQGQQLINSGVDPRNTTTIRKMQISDKIWQGKKTLANPKLNWDEIVTEKKIVTIF